MEVYKFISAKWGVESLKARRILVSKIDTLNDPFEILPMRLEGDLRKVWIALKIAFMRNSGLICFSSSWKNPVMWAHYANNAKGMVLGFTVPDDRLIQVKYSTKRLLGMEAVKSFEDIVATKFYHWRYEKEFRWVVPWNEATNKDGNGNAYLRFGADLKLNNVFLGPNYSREEAEGCCKNLQNDLEAKGVQIITTRPAFKSYMFVEQKLKNMQKSL